MESDEYYLESKTSETIPKDVERPRNRFRVGFFAAASALAGGMAAAWFYRKTLSRLRQAEIDSDESQYLPQGSDPDDE